MTKNRFSRSNFGSWGGFLGVLGASLYWKVVSEFWFGHPKCHFWYPQNGKNGVFWPFWGYQKLHLGCPNQNSKTTFQYKLAPKTPKKPPQEPKSDVESDLWSFFQFCIFLRRFPISTGRLFKMRFCKGRRPLIKKCKKIYCS